MPITAPIIVLAASDVFNWIELNTVKDELEIPLVDTTQDARLNRLIGVASSRLLKFTNLRQVAFQRYEETLAGFGETILLLSRTPLVNLISVEFITTDVFLEGDPGTDITTDIVIQDAEMSALYRLFGWQWGASRGSVLDVSLAIPRDAIPGTEESNFRFQYEAGFTMPGQTVPAETTGLPAPQVAPGPDPFPPDLQEAALAQVKYDFRRRARVGDISDKRVDDTFIRFNNPSDEDVARRFGLAPDAFYLADPYRRAA